MNPADEQELHRLCAILASIEQSLPDPSPLREGLIKAGLALTIAFMDERRGWIENTYAHLDAPLSMEQKAHLIKAGIDPAP